MAFFNSIVPDDGVYLVLPAFRRLYRGFFDIVRCIEIRFTCAEADYITALRFNSFALAVTASVADGGTACALLLTFIVVFPFKVSCFHRPKGIVLDTKLSKTRQENRLAAVLTTNTKRVLNLP